MIAPLSVTTPQIHGWTAAALSPLPDRFTASDPPALVPSRASLEAAIRGKEAPAIPTRQFADSYGRVTHLALMLSDYAEGDMREQVLNAYRILFTEMEPDTKFSIVVESPRDRADVERVIRDAGVPDPERIRFVEPGVGDLTVWARDMMVGMYTPDDPARTALLNQTTLHDWHDSDMRVPAVIAERNPSILLDTEPRLVTDGGDVTANTNESFVGYYSVCATEIKLGEAMEADPALKARLFDYYQKEFGKEAVDEPGVPHFPMMWDHVDPPYKVLVHDPEFQRVDAGPGRVTEQQMCEDLAVRLFEEHLGKPVQVLGRDNVDTPQIEEPATDHQDMGMTPIDDRTCLVGDPNLAARIIAEMAPDERRAAEATLAKAVGHPVSLAQDAIFKNRDNPHDFDEYARILSDKGYNVVRVPHVEPKNAGWDPYISYNNCLMERFEKDGREVRRVFLPVYGIPKLDDAALEIWRSQGFEVHPVPLNALSTQWGALRCISNWLERSPRG